LSERRETISRALESRQGSQIAVSAPAVILTPVAAFSRRSTASALGWPIIASHINAEAARGALGALLDAKAAGNEGIDSF
jgi:hypothetical protein